MTIRIEALSHTFTTSRGALPVLRDINLTIRQAEFVAVLGPSGCGKSTLLRLLANLIQPVAGRIDLAGQTPAQASAAKRIGWMAQRPALLPWYTVRENIALAQRINPQPTRTVPAVDDLLALIGLSDFDTAYPLTLSGGMQQRVALARTLALGADVWLMDEPFSALDELTRDSLTTELLGLWQTFRPTVVWVTHHIQETVRLADRVVVMSSRPGRLHTDTVIPLPRPRDDTAPDFQPLVRDLRAALAHRL